MITPLDDKSPQAQIDQTPQPSADTSMPPPYSVARAPTETNILGRKVDVPSLLSEVEWQLKLKKLEKKIRKYNWTKQGDEAAIVASMRDLATSHNDPQVQTYWNRRADEFEKAPDTDKTAILVDIGRGLAILIAAPFAIAGAMLIGTGMLLKASGNFLTGGKVGKMTMPK
ncbi:hypothetical protein B0H19DRAFT_292015 [Mycena capillaripes]|nr:hypothetical protein B0H19DRAFT_292015 [Mycena capillaripes]